MPFTGYTDLQASVADWLARDDLEPQIVDFIWLAECDIQRAVKFRLADKIQVANSIAGQGYVELPEDYAEGGFLRWTGSTSMPSLEVGSYDMMHRHQQAPFSSNISGGDTIVSTLHGNRLYIGQEPGEIAYELFYKAGVQHLTAKDPSNYILKEYPDCLLFGALVVAAPYLGADERIGTWATMYTNAKEETRMAEWRARSGHGALRMRSDVWPLA